MTGDRRFAVAAAVGTFVVGVLIGMVATLANLVPLDSLTHLSVRTSGPGAVFARTAVGWAGTLFAATFVALTTYGVVRRGASPLARVAHVVAGVSILVPLSFLLLLSGAFSLLEPLEDLLQVGVPLAAGVALGVKARTRDGNDEGADPVPWTAGLNVALAVALFAGILLGSAAGQAVRPSLVTTERSMALGVGLACSLGWV